MAHADEPDSPVPDDAKGEQPEPLDADEGEPDIEPFAGEQDDDADGDGALGGKMPGSSGR